MRAIKILLISVCSLLILPIAYGQSLEQEVDSLYQVSVETADPEVLKELINKSRHWLDRSRVAKDNKNVAKAYLALSRAHFLLGEESESLKLFKLYMIESNQQALDSLNSLTSRQVQNYEHEVKALLKVQEDLESENSELKSEQNDLFTKNKYIFYGLMALLLIGFIVLFMRLIADRNNPKLTKNEKVSEESEVENPDNPEGDEISDVLTSLIDEIHQVEFKTLPGIKNHFLLYHPIQKTGGDGIWLHTTYEKVIFAIFNAPMIGSKGFLFNEVVKKNLSELVVDDTTLAPSLILTHLEQRLKEADLQASSEKGLAIGIGSFDLKDKYFDYAAASLTLYISQDNETRHFQGDTQPLLSSARQKGYFSTERIDLGKPTKLIFGTDGLAQQLGGKESKEFGRKGVIQAINETMSQPTTTQASILEKLFISWKGPLSQSDDILFVGMEF